MQGAETNRGNLEAGATAVPNTDQTAFIPRVAFSRRTLLAAGLASGLMFPIHPNRGYAGAPAAWHTWLLRSVDELRPPIPAAPTHAEVGELLDFRDRRSPETAVLVEQWNSGPAILPWTN